ncbi:SbcC/MukB-like Walker B domain-containing protein, partial [Nocardiopsis coralliicola]
RRHAEAAERSAALTARSGHRAALDAELAAADRAAGVLPVIGAARARRDELAKAEQDAAEQRALAAGLGPAPGADDPLQSGAERLRAAERERRDEIARLAHLRGDADRAAALATETSQIAAALERARADGAAVAEHAARLPERRATIAAALAEARTRTGPREAAEEALEAARARSAAVADAARLGTELARAAAARRSAVDAAQAAQDALLEVRRRRLDGMAAELAAGLEAGAPCPVCGAAEHPAPSAGGADRPSGADEERARSAADAARDRRTGAERAEAGLEAQHAAVLERAGGLDSAAAAELVRSRTAALDELDAARAQADQLARRLEEADTELERARTAAARRDREAAELAERQTARTAEARALAERLDAARGTDPDLPSRTARLEAEADLLAGAAAAADRRSAAAAELRTAEGELRRAVAEAGFDDADAAGRAARDGAARSALTAQAREYDTALAAARAVLAEPETAAAAAGAEPDTAAAAAALRRTEAAADAAHAWHDRLVQRGARCTEMRGELERLLTASRPARERHRVADGLARLAAGTSPANQHSVRLSSYVLAARLEQVVAAANDRLATMSGGRYALRHTVEAAAGDRSHSGGGLGLRAVDAWTGQERDPATLSGGESFIASLALALGLADVATEEAGGTDIGTLFVDEGFGTLDEDTLEEVMDVLDRLRDGGRAVGVVSHVADLRARIPSRLHVRKSPAGSHLHQTP